jgi:hypothetical protein
MTIRVMYGTSGFLHQNDGQPGKQCEQSFASLDVAKSKPLPAGCTFAFIRADDGDHVYSPKFGWEFYRDGI